MSTVSKRPNARKPKATQKSAAESVVVPVSDAAPVNDESPVPATTDSPAEVVEKVHKNVPVIAPARVRRFIDSELLNAEINKEISQYLTDLSTLNVAEKKLAEEVPPENAETLRKVVADMKLKYKNDELQDIVKAFNHEKMRFACDASMVLSLLCEEVISQLVTFAQKSQSKMLKCDDIHCDGIDQLTLYPLFRGLPSFVSLQKKIDVSKRASDDAALTKIVTKQLIAEFSKKFSIKGGERCIKKALQQEDDDDVPATPQSTPVAPLSVVDAGKRLLFLKYVGDLIKKLKAAAPETSNYRCSKELKQYLALLTEELLLKISKLVLVTVSSMKIKTINSGAIMKTIEALMIDGHDYEVSVKLESMLQNDPAFVKAEKDKAKADKSYKPNYESAPKVTAFVVHKDVKYKTSAFADLSSKIQEAAKSYKADDEEDVADE